MKRFINTIAKPLMLTIKGLSLMACMVLLTACPSFKSVKQPQTALVNSVIETHLEILIDSETSQGSLALQIPAGWKALTAQIVNLPGRPVYVFKETEIPPLFDGCGGWEGEYPKYWLSTIPEKLVLSYGIYRVKVKMITGSDYGTYPISYSLMDGWTSDYHEANIELVLSSDESDDREELSIFPNPVSDHLNILFSTGESFSSQLFDLDGERYETLVSSNGSMEMDVSNVPDGIYYVKVVTSNNQLHSEKIIVKH